MSNENRMPQDGGMMFEMVRKEGGQTVVYRTDSECDFIRQNVEDHITEYGLGDQVKVDVKDAREGWTRVEITFDPDLAPDDWMQIGTDFQVAFSPSGKGWYDCREEGQNQDGTRVWWIVKHKHGLWI